MPESGGPAFILAVLLMAGPVQAQSTHPLAQVGWLAGCWEGSDGHRTVEERWMAARGESMLGVGRTVRDGALRDYELVLLTEQNGRLAYEAHPRGQPANTFHSIEVTDSSVVFEDPAHDYPQRVGYRHQGDSLFAWIDGTIEGNQRRIDFPYRRVSCD